MKTYVIILSQKFPKGHRREGEDTYFKFKFLLGQHCPDCEVEQDLSGENISQCNSCARSCFSPKIHTIRANYDLWKERIAKVQRGEACISVREWTDKPYRSPQVEIARLTREDGIGLQKLTFRRVEQQCITGEPRFDGFERKDEFDFE